MHPRASRQWLWRAIPALLVLVASMPCAAGGSSLRIVDDEREALQARIDLIQRAERTIELAYYAVDTDEVPIALMELLRQASLRGVKVRMLVDGLKSRLPAAFERYLRQHGIQIRVFHPPCTGNPSWLNRRLHSKMIVADSNTAIIGSRNLQNECFEFDDQNNFVDCDALVSGDVASHARRYFDWLWNTPDVQRNIGNDSLGLDILNYRPYGQSAYKKSWRQADTGTEYQRLLDRAVQRVICRFNVDLHSSCDWSDGSIDGIELELLHDQRTDKRERHVQSTIVRMLDCANHSILIESPYPAFNREIRCAISRARRRGVCVTIFTNSLETTDQVNVYAAYQNQKRSLLREGVHLREFWGKDTLHAKTMIVDGSTWMLGSYNFDSRSNNLNIELCIVSADPAGAAQLRRSVQRRLGKSDPVDDAVLLPEVGRNRALKKRASLIFKRAYIELCRSFL